MLKKATVGSSLLKSCKNKTSVEPEPQIKKSNKQTSIEKPNFSTVELNLSKANSTETNKRKRSTSNR